MYSACDSIELCLSQQPLSPLEKYPDLDFYKLITTCAESWQQRTLTEEKQPMFGHFLPTQMKKEPTEVKAEAKFSGKDVTCQIATCTLL